MCTVIFAYKPAFFIFYFYFFFLIYFSHCGCGSHHSACSLVCRSVLFAVSLCLVHLLVCLSLKANSCGHVGNVNFLAHQIEKSYVLPRVRNSFILYFTMKTNVYQNLIKLVFSLI